MASPAALLAVPAATTARRAPVAGNRSMKPFAMVREGRDMGSLLLKSRRELRALEGQQQIACHLSVAQIPLRRRQARCAMRWTVHNTWGRKLAQAVPLEQMREVGA